MVNRIKLKLRLGDQSTRITVTGTTMLPSHSSHNYDETSPNVLSVISAVPEVDAASLLPPTVLSN
jgi:hypothetical protein